MQRNRTALGLWRCLLPLVAVVSLAAVTSPVMAGRLTSITTGWRAGSSNTSKHVPSNPLGYSIFLTREYHDASNVNYSTGYWQTSPLDGSNRMVQRWEATWRMVIKNHHMGGADGVALGFVPTAAAGVANESGAGRDGVWFSLDTFYGSLSQQRVSVYRNGTRYNSVVPTTSLKDQWLTVRAVLEETSSSTATAELFLNNTRQFSQSIPWSEYAGVFNFGARVGQSASLHEVADFDMRTYAPNATIVNRPYLSFGASSTVDFGDVRVGTTETAVAYVHNTGDIDTTLRGTVPQNVGAEFSTSSSTVSVPRLSSFSTPYRGVGYRFTPASRSSVSETATAETNAGDVVFALTGSGVGPQYHASYLGREVLSGESVDLGEHSLGEEATLWLTLRNITSDAGESSLTGLSILEYDFVGENASFFRFTSFSDADEDGVLLAYQSGLLGIAYDASVLGSHAVQLRITTDQNAAFGAEGDVFVYNLTAVTVPEPTAEGLFVLAAIAGGLFVCSQRGVALWSQRRGLFVSHAGGRGTGV